MTLDQDVEKVAAAIYVADTNNSWEGSFRYRRMARAAIEASPNNTREMRTLKWKLKSIGRQLGKAGQTIYQLRTEVAYVATHNSITPGDYRRCLERMRAAEAEVEQLQEKLKTLHTKESRYSGPDLGDDPDGDLEGYDGA